MRYGRVESAASRPTSVRDGPVDVRAKKIRVSAEGFLRYMVRAIAGTLMAVGRGELGRDAIAEAVETGTRPTTAVTAPARGLTLLSVRYQ